MFRIVHVSLLHQLVFRVSAMLLSLCRQTPLPLMKCASKLPLSPTLSRTCVCNKQQFFMWSQFRSGTTATKNTPLADRCAQSRDRAPPPILDVFSVDSDGDDTILVENQFVSTHQKRQSFSTTITGLRPSTTSHHSRTTFATPEFTTLQSRHPQAVAFARPTTRPSDTERTWPSTATLLPSLLVDASIGASLVRLPSAAQERALICTPFRLIMEP